MRRLKMKKIPTLFKREFDKHIVINISPELSDESLSWVLSGEGTVTEKIDGSCCAVIYGIFYKRYDAKKGKQPPKGAIPCDEPDPITGHWPHWVKVDENNAGDKWFVSAYKNTDGEISDGTYEAVGPHFNGNPHKLDDDILIKHGESVIELPDRSFESIRDYLEKHNIEGIVFWKNNEPECKIKRRDFGFKWPDNN